jgi:hypothetical protein
MGATGDPPVSRAWPAPTHGVSNPFYGLGLRPTPWNSIQPM